jgi:hypothetical protein
MGRTAHPNYRGGELVDAFIDEEVRIIIPMVELMKLETWCASAGGKEVSGVGTLKFEKGKFYVNEVFLCAGGSEVYTQIEPEHIMEVVKQGVDPSAIKLWWHRHPMGNGLPGPQCWSGTDQNTITTAPLGSSPDMVEWSVSIVRTPYGWVGRMDDYRKKHTLHTNVAQVFTPAEHAHLKKVITARTAHHAGSQQSRGGASDIGTIPDKKPSKVHSYAREVEAWLHGRKRPGRNPRDTNKYRKKMMRQFDVDDEMYDDMLDQIEAKRLPEHVSEEYGLDVFAFRELGIIDEDQLNSALDRIEWVDDNIAMLEAGEITAEEVPDALLDWVKERYEIEDDDAQMELL